MLRCPLCRARLRRVVELDVEIDVCNYCHGVWLDQGELRAVSGADDPVSTPIETDELGPLICPRCETTELVGLEAGAFRLMKCSICEGFFCPGAVLDALAASKNQALLRDEMPYSPLGWLGSVRGLGITRDLLSLFRFK